MWRWSHGLAACAIAIPAWQHDIACSSSLWIYKQSCRMGYNVMVTILNLNNESLL